MNYFLACLLFVECLSASPAIELEPKKTLKRQLAGGESHEYEFTLQAGGYALLRTSQRSINLAVHCLGPDGEELFSADAFPIGDGEDVELIGQVSGRYRLRLTPSEPNAPVGGYEITLEKIGPATERLRHRAAAARDFAQAIALYRQGTREAMSQATGHLSAATAHWRTSGDGTDVARALYTAALVFIDTGDQDKALTCATQALAEAQAVKDKRTEARALNSIGEVHNYFGDRRKAASYYEQALPLMRETGDRGGEGNALNNLAVAYAHTGEKSKALALFDQATRIFGELQDRLMIAEVTGNLGVTYDNLGEYQRALDCHQKVFALKSEVGERAGQAISLNNIGTAYSGLGSYQKALDAYASALEINRSLENQRNVAINLNNIAWVYGQLADLRRALAFYQEALGVIRAIRDRRTTAVTLNNIAEITADLGKYQSALELHLEALSLRREVSDTDGEANSLSHLGAVLAKLGQTDKARDHFERALAIFKRSSNPFMRVRALTSLGVLERESGDILRAIDYLNQARDASRSIQDESGQAGALAELARVERSRGNYAAAHQLCQKAMSALESVRLSVASPALRARFFASVRDVQELDIELLMRLHALEPDGGFAAAALFVSEKGRARSLLELLGESSKEIRFGVDSALLKRERELQHLISGKAELQRRLMRHKHTEEEGVAASKELDGLVIQLENIQSRIRQTSPHYAALTQPLPLNLEEIQTKVLDEDTALLEYSLGSEKSFVWLVTPTSVSVFELPSRLKIESAVKRLYNLLTARNQRAGDETASTRVRRIRSADESYFTAASRVSEMLLDPVASEIESKRLLIVGEGILQYLPFAALPEPGSGERGKPAPLAAKHEIVTAPSASVLAVLRHETAGRKPAQKAIAVFADPVFSSKDDRFGLQRPRSGLDPGGPGFLRLRFSRYEAEEISRLAPTNSTWKVLDFDASRDSALDTRLGGYRIVHFATHSVLDSVRPELSGIVLSLYDRSGQGRSGFLRLYDIYNLRLSSDLVVLSGCQTALGEEVKGEGLIGITRGFLYAGAPRVVASLWEVDDRATAELMKRFYEGMFVRRETAAAALRAAQLEMWRIRGWNAPYYWAAFLLQGEWR